MVHHGRKERHGRTYMVRNMREGILSRVLSFCEKAGMMPIEGYTALALASVSLM